MSLHAEFRRYCALLAEDVAGLSPYAMASIVGYGNFGGYDPLFLEIRDDVRECCAVLSVVDPKFDASAASEPLAAQARRPLDEGLLMRERDRLAHCLESVRSATGALSPTDFDAALDNAPAGSRTKLLDRLRAAGLGASLEATMVADRPPVDPTDLNMAAETLLLSLQETDTQATRGHPIYVSPRIAGGLSRQIIPALREAGLRPVAAEEPLRSDSNDEAWNFLCKRIASCRGGVMSLSQEDAAAAEREIAEGLKCFPERILIVAEARLIEERRPEIGDHLLFPLSGPTMNAVEAARFASILERNW